MLCAQPVVNPAEERYQTVLAELTRGIYAVSGLNAGAAGPGWLGVECASTAMATWLQEAVALENIQAASQGALLLLPIAHDYRLEDEIKSIITVVAKTTDYWYNHLPPDVKRTLEIQAALSRWVARLREWWPF
ncbi:MAG: hypothetical protein H0T73_13430 [Ardenticatenales bacterium]|nr:hypothetical protein [Ardenticatenales bacterium]